MSDNDNNTAKSFDDKPSRWPIFLAVFVVLLAGGYTVYWFYAADQAKKSYLAFLYDLTEEDRTFKTPVASGFPGPLTLHVDREYLQSPDGTLQADNISLKGWLLPGVPAHIHADSITVSSFRWREPLAFQSLDADISILGSVMTIHDAVLRHADFAGGAKGTIDLAKEPYPEFDLTVQLHNHLALMVYLTKMGIVEERNAMFISAGLSVFQKDGVVTVPLTQSGNTLYAGPLAVAKLPVPEPSPLISVKPDNRPDL